MRVTANTFPNAIAVQLGKLAERQEILQRQVASGLRIEAPSDDPQAFGLLMDIEGKRSATRQYRKNIGVLGDQASASYGSMSGLKTILMRAREIATKAQDIAPQSELDAYAIELKELLEGALEAANRQHRGNYLFAGTRSNQPPFVAARDPNGFLDSVAYQGNDSAVSAEISQGVAISSATVGANTSGAGPRGLLIDSASGTDVFGHLIALQNHLRTGDRAAIRSMDQPALARDESNLQLHVATVGSTLHRLEATDRSLDQQLFELDKAASHQADADLAKVLTELSSNQTAYQAVAQSAGRTLNRSLLDYL